MTCSPGNAHFATSMRLITFFSGSRAPVWAKGASRYVIDEAASNGWTLLAAAYCLEEAQRNARKVGPEEPTALAHSIAPLLALVPTELAFDKALVFPKAKDRPVLLSALWMRHRDFESAIVHD